MDESERYSSTEGNSFVATVDFTLDDLRTVVREEIGDSVPGIIQDTFPGIVRDLVPGIIHETVPSIVTGIINSTVPGIVTGIIQDTVPGIVTGIIQETVPGIVTGIIRDTVPGIVTENIQDTVPDIVHGIVQQEILSEREYTWNMINEASDGVLNEVVKVRKMLEEDALAEGKRLTKVQKHLDKTSRILMTHITGPAAHEGQNISS